MYFEAELDHDAQIHRDVIAAASNLAVALLASGWGAQALATASRPSVPTTAL
ncbi:hypothetical protein ACFWD7_16725 [Streptomyces mirabilis]|uniref:hypothetical protein n=1 Tax=Streptomyces mirabilis TaxID=68239 RepID=UPI0021BF9435|nr:hypothetical protein [Streptomyces mirabilis]MCT9112712.1 hypothetical protein [Streptomyces mirabilis]